MTYPASPRDAATNRVRPDSAQFWAGAVATAVVAALIALVGILICRWTLHIPILAPRGDGAWGNAHTAEYALVAALIAVIAAGLLYLLVLGTPQPSMFFNWIMGLATLAAVVYPFSTGAPLDQKFATAAVNLVLGIAIIVAADRGGGQGDPPPGGAGLPSAPRCTSKRRATRTARPPSPTPATCPSRAATSRRSRSTSSTAGPAATDAGTRGPAGP